MQQSDVEWSTLLGSIESLGFVALMQGLPLTAHD
jgi:hypothetical protein